MENREEMHIKQMNAEENYMTTPISVLSYITVLEEQNKQLLDEIEMLNFKLKAADSVNEGLQYKIAQSIPALMDCKNIIEQSESTIIGKTYMNMKCIEINRLLNDLTNQNK